MKKNILSILLISLIVTFYSCVRDNTIQPDIPKIEKYIHIAHTRTNTNPKMDSVVEQIDYTKFDMIWLGGDLAYLTSQDNLTMSHIDSIFHFDNPNTLWSLGNHDYSDIDRVQLFTNRPTFYSYYKSGITFIVLNTQSSHSSIIDLQKELFDRVTDTIQTSSYLIILHHKLIWMYGNSYLEPQIDSVSNGRLGDCSYCINPNNFYTDIYPKLLEVRQRGIKVICIGGDIGMKVKEFEYVTPEDIYFLASGIFKETDGNKALIFSNDIKNKQLTWKYKLISDL